MDKVELDTENYTEDGAPKKCKHCGSDNIDYKSTDHIDYMVCEAEYRCGDCGELLGRWAYGNFEPDFYLKLKED